MKITVKTLQQQSYPLDIQETEKVLEIKQKLEKQLGHAIEQQKLIFSGKILADDKSVSEYAVKEGDFFVLMITKKTQPTASTSASKPAAAAAPIKTEPVKPESISTASTSATSAATPSETPATTGGLLMGPEYESAVANLVEMGFDRLSVTAAMKAAFNNPDRAVEYLMNGIPSSLNEPVAAASQSGSAPVGSEMEEDNEDVDPESAFSALTSNPEFQQIRQLIRQQPQLLEPLLQQLGQSNPQLLQLIGSNPDAFMQWLEGSEGGLELGSTTGQAPQQGQNVVTLTQEEMEAVNRLVSLGFDRNQAVEAYLACDKNEELAANFLFDQNF